MTVLGEPRVPKHRAMIDPALLLLNPLVSVAFWFGRWVQRRVLRGRAVSVPRPRDRRLVSGLALHAARSVRDLSSRRARPCPPKVPPVAYMHGTTPFNTPTRHLDASSRKPR